MRYVLITCLVLLLAGCGGMGGQGTWIVIHQTGNGEVTEPVDGVPKGGNVAVVTLTITDGGTDVGVTDPDVNTGE